MSRVGRSIEEIIVMGQLEQNGDGNAIRMSSTLGNLRRLPSSAKSKTRPTPKGKNVLPKSENERTIIENLMEHSRNLQLRLQEMETRFILSENNAENLRYELERAQQREAELVSAQQFGSRMGSRVGTPLLGSSHGQRRVPSSYGGMRQSATPSSPGKSSHHPPHSSPTKPVRIMSSPGSRMTSIDSSADAEDMGKTVYEMEDHINELRHIFRPTDPLQERHWAAIKIQSRIRTFIVRQRYYKYWNALRSWRTGKILNMMPVLELKLANAARVDLGMRGMQLKRDHVLVGAIFNRWQHICKQSAPFRRSMVIAAEEKFQAKRFKLKLEAFVAFKNGTIGNESHKHIRKERRLLVEQIRAQIQEEMVKDGRQNMLVSESDVQRSVYREIVRSSITKKESRNKALIFKTFRTLHETAIKNKRKAYMHKFAKYAGKCFYAWSDWTYAVGSGLERKRWAGPRKYEVRYNQKLVEYFAKNRLKKTTFGPWVRYARTSKIVNFRFMVKQTKLMRDVVSVWHQLTSKHKGLRQLTYNNWSNYAKNIMTPPFTAWKDFASSASVRRMQQNNLVTAYVRWKTRQKHIQILRMWRHQALYGGIEGMYSRTTISKSLGEQKGISAALQKMITKQTLDLEECRDMVHKETIARKKLEDLVTEKDSDIEKLKVTNHHMDMELRRLYGIIEAMARINPAQVQHIKNMQPDFEFQLRKIQPSLAAASAEELFATAGEDGDRGPSDAGINTPNEVGSAHKGVITSSDVASVISNGSVRDAIGNDHATSYAEGLALENFMKPLAIPDPARIITADDRRLLNRLKWVLHRLVDVEPESVKEEKPNDDGQEDNLEEEDEEDFMDDDEDEPQIVATPRDVVNERTVTELLKDAADGKETIFIVNLLSFIKDGNTRCLTEVDRRLWAEDLLAKATPDGPISAHEDPMASGRLGVVHGSDKPFDMDSWRNVLVHLRTNYPVGVAGRIANAKFNDELDEAQTGILERVKTMQTDLMEVVEFKRNKVKHSRFGQTLQSSLLLKSGDGSMSSNVFTLNEDDEDEEEDDVEKINVYADRVLFSPHKGKQPGAAGEGGAGGDDDEDLSQYDDFSLTGDPAKAGQSMLAIQKQLVQSVESASASQGDDDGDSGFAM